MFMTWKKVNRGYYYKLIIRQFIMNSNITISDGVVPLKIVQDQQLDPRVIESLESSIESMIQEKRQNILPAKKSDILKKCIFLFFYSLVARSIISSRKKPKETDSDNIFGNLSLINYR